jgi:hypothetical protein
MVSTWCQATVEKVLDEMVFVRPQAYSQKFAAWIGVDLDKLAPSGGVLNSYKVICSIIHLLIQFYRLNWRRAQAKNLNMMKTLK